jgi:hypothetical protein
VRAIEEKARTVHRALAGFEFTDFLRRPWRNGAALGSVAASGDNIRRVPDPPLDAANGGGAQRPGPAFAVSLPSRVG